MFGPFWYDSWGWGRRPWPVRRDFIIVRRPFMPYRRFWW